MVLLVLRLGSEGVKCQDVCHKPCHPGPCEPPVCRADCTLLKEPEPMVTRVRTDNTHQSVINTVRNERPLRPRPPPGRNEPQSPAIKRTTFRQRWKQSEILQKIFTSVFLIAFLNAPLIAWIYLQVKYYTQPLDHQKFTEHDQWTFFSLGALFSFFIVPMNGSLSFIAIRAWKRELFTLLNMERVTIGMACWKVLTRLFIETILLLFMMLCTIWFIPA